MNKQSLKNFIKLTNPIGEYFEEFGGIYAGTDKWGNKLIFIAERKYHKLINGNFVNLNISLPIDNPIFAYAASLTINNIRGYQVPSEASWYIVSNIIKIKFIYYNTLNNYYKFYDYDPITSEFKLCEENKTYNIVPIRFESYE